MCIKIHFVELKSKSDSLNSSILSIQYWIRPGIILVVHLNQLFWKGWRLDLQGRKITEKQLIFKYKNSDTKWEKCNPELSKEIACRSWCKDLKTSIHSAQEIKSCTVKMFQILPESFKIKLNNYLLSCPGNTYNLNRRYTLQTPPGMSQPCFKILFSHESFFFKILYPLKK